MDRRNSRFVGLAILSLALAGCASEATPQATTSSPNTASPSPNAAVVKKSPGAIQSFNNPVVPAKNESPVAAATSNLIQPTNATERAVVVSKGRNDPFAQIIGDMPMEVPNENNMPKPVPTVPPLPIRQITVPPTKVKISPPKPASVSARKAVISVRLPPKKTPSLMPRLTPVLPKVLPPVVPSQNLVSVLPKPQQPDLAKAVIVSGVVLLGNKLQAIIKVPNEPASMYVQAGQRLANGLLIKRIEMYQGDNPVVIVEQYGIEVARMVGEAPSATAPAANPGSATTPPQNPVNTGA